MVAAGNFSQASSRLFITQSTVSARIATLEEQLGCRLFVRNKAGTSLTPAGFRFQNYAITLVRTIERARQDIGVVRGYRASVTIGAVWLMGGSSTPLPTADTQGGGRGRYTCGNRI